jgi:hypothetical protein
MKKKKKKKRRRRRKHTNGHKHMKKFSISLIITEM